MVKVTEGDRKTEAHASDCIDRLNLMAIGLLLILLWQ